MVLALNGNDGGVGDPHEVAAGHGVAHAHVHLELAAVGHGRVVGPQLGRHQQLQPVIPGLRPPGQVGDAAEVKLEEVHVLTVLGVDPATGREGARDKKEKVEDGTVLKGEAVLK